MKNKILVAIVAIVLVVILAGAGYYVLADNNDDDSKETITVGYCNKVCYESFMIAEENGYFNGLDVNIEAKIIPGGGTDVSSALLKGEVDLAAMGDTPAVQNLNTTDKTSIVCRYGYSESMHVFVARPNSGIDVDDLSTVEGKTIGVQQGSSTEGALLDWMNVDHIDTNKVTWKYLKPNVQVEALSKGDVDMIASSQPNPQKALHLEGTYVVGTSEGLGNYYPLILLGSNSVISEKADAVNAVVDALKKASDFMKDNHEKAAEIAANKIGWAVDDELYCMQQITWEVGFTQEIDVKSLEKTAQVLRDNGQDISKDLNFVERSIMKP